MCQKEFWIFNVEQVGGEVAGRVQGDGQAVPEGARATASRVFEAFEGARRRQTRVRTHADLAAQVDIKRASSGCSDPVVCCKELEKIGIFASFGAPPAGGGAQLHEERMDLSIRRIYPSTASRPFLGRCVRVVVCAIRVHFESDLMSMILMIEPMLE